MTQRVYCYRVILGLVATLLMNLVPLRYFFGLRLFSVVPDSSRDEMQPIPWCRADADLALLAEAWLMLPDEVRNQIVALASVAEAWPNLPDAVRRQIVTAVRGSQGSPAANERFPASESTSVGA